MEFAAGTMEEVTILARSKFDCEKKLSGWKSPVVKVIMFFLVGHILLFIYTVFQEKEYTENMKRRIRNNEDRWLYDYGFQSSQFGVKPGCDGKGNCE
ncbi:hypothetical protein [Pseudobacteriovorax antillogorgiicola]|nr:hypothetical protein [Pseudobacteriovorax antillogorgiicola]